MNALPIQTIAMQMLTALTIMEDLLVLARVVTVVMESIAKVSD